MLRAARKDARLMSEQLREAFEELQKGTFLKTQSPR